MSKNIIIITGASSGMGMEFVKQIDRKFPHVDEVWLIARRKDILENLAAECYHECRIFAHDICEKHFREAFCEVLTKEKPSITLLINSAGYGILGPFCNKDQENDLSHMEEQCGMIRLNCEALTAITYLCIPYIKRGGRIIQLASSAAFVPQPKFAVYAATKSYVLSFSRALNEELRKDKITVTAVCPGPVDTPFFERAEVGTDTLAIKKLMMAKSKEVVKQALLDSRNRKEVSVYSLPIRLFYGISKVFPHKFMLVVMRFLK